MFNVTVIRLRDILKIIVIVISIYILSKFVFESVFIKNVLNQTIGVDRTHLIKLGINIECEIFESILEDNEDVQQEKTEEVEADWKNISINSVLRMESNIFKIGEDEQIIGQDRNEDIENTNTNLEEQKTAQAQEITTDSDTQVVTQNPIADKYNIEYNGIKIKNETSYELTDDILNVKNLDIDKKDVLIFHTHTCESYTQTEDYKYEPSRKLSYNKSELFCSKSWR